jgi:hypothetical protein
MIYYFSGIIIELQHPRLAFMNTPQMANILAPDTRWAADNGRFNAPEKYTDDGYLAWLDRQHRKNCAFATAPDVLGNHLATVELSRPLFTRLRALGYRPAFVAQDGWYSKTTPWNEFDVLFIGGSTEFKLSLAAYNAIQEAKQRRKWVHMGRVNSFKRLRYAARIGCHCADGTFLKYAPLHNISRMLRWFDKLDRIGL